MSGDDDGGTGREFAYAIPAAIVIFAHVLLAIGFLAGLVPMVVGSRQWAADDITLLGVGLLVSVIGLVLAVLLWAQRRWLILAVPLITIPVALVVAVQYGIRNWGY